MDRTIRRKADTIQRCIKRIEQERQYNLFEDIVHQDALLLNLQRACQAAIDMAVVIVKEKQLGSPTGTYEVFEILLNQEIIEIELYESMRSMIGFRNILVHDYTALDMKVVLGIVENHLDDLKFFSKIALQIT